MVIDYVSGSNGVVFYACFMSLLVAIAAFFSLRPIFRERKGRRRSGS